MGKNDSNDYWRVFWLSMATTFFVMFSWADAPAQKVPRRNSEREKLLRTGARQINSSGTEFEVDGARLTLHYSMANLAAVQVKVNGIASKPEYDRLVELVEQIKPLGAFKADRGVGVIGPSGWVTRTAEFSNAYIVRMEQACSSANTEPGCGVKKFTVFYWLPLVGKVEDKRVEVITLGELIKTTRYYVTVNDSEVQVSAPDYQRLHKEQSVSLERTLGNDLARVIAPAPQF